MKQVRENQNTTSTVTNSYKCAKCKDTTWLLNDEGKAIARCECYELDYTRIIWERFGVNPENVKLLRNYNAYNETTIRAKKLAVEYIENFEEIIKSDKNWFGLMGQPGAGKTHIVIAMGKALLDKKIPVVYISYIEATRELKSCANDTEYYNKLSDRYKKAKVLIIDDFFKEKVRNGKLIGELTEVDTKHIQPILNYRYLNKLPTLFSTECTPEMLRALDGSMGDRMLERFDGKFGVVFKQDSNYRMKAFENKK